jgi:hypothetical protein
VDCYLSSGSSQWIATLAAEAAGGLLISSGSTMTEMIAQAFVTCDKAVLSAPLFMTWLPTVSRHFRTGIFF